MPNGRFTPSTEGDLATVSAPTPEDQLEISRLFYRYAHAIDGKDFDSLFEIFTEDAIIHYDMMGGTKLPLAEMVEWLRENLQIFRVTQHAVSNPMIEMDGGADSDTARSICYLTASHQQIDLEGRSTVFIDKGAYHDRLRRTASGWRIERRTLERFLLHGDFVSPDQVKRFDTAPPVLADPY